MKIELNDIKKILVLIKY
ncbi:Protein of unknown function [Lactobacillus acidophilus DSM 20079 = JCM 1132 = NBRC 13951 = CIP 76.13]|nr:Protein of unknown function [Lactobacillus acidophilus DSM 20079 = JCM 1132 = NBRC 13951 = CIP 76.13]